MTLKSALQDLKENTLAFVSGMLGKLAYLASLRRAEGKYEHWGLEFVHGPEASERALRSAHSEVVSGILRTPLPELLRDLEKSSEVSGLEAREYVEGMRGRFDELLPAGKQDQPSASHLNSVLLALSKLKERRARATRSIS